MHNIRKSFINDPFSIQYILLESKRLIEASTPYRRELQREFLKEKLENVYDP